MFLLLVYRLADVVKVVDAVCEAHVVNKVSEHGMGVDVLVVAADGNLGDLVLARDTPGTGILRFCFRDLVDAVGRERGAGEDGLDCVADCGFKIVHLDSPLFLVMPCM